MGSATLQSQLWGSAPHDWAELQKPTSAPLWEAMLDATGVGPGTRLLDTRCAAGGASILAAGRGALVHGIDTASQVATARHRVPDGDVQIGDLEILPDAESAFDVILATAVVLYTTQPAAGVRELARVCRLGGRVVMAVWSPEKCAQRSVPQAVPDLLSICLGQEACALSAQDC